MARLKYQNKKRAGKTYDYARLLVRIDGKEKPINIGASTTKRHKERDRSFKKTVSELEAIKASGEKLDSSLLLKLLSCPINHRQDSSINSSVFNLMIISSCIELLIVCLSIRQVHNIHTLRDLLFDFYGWSVRCSVTPLITPRIFPLLIREV